MEEDASWCAWPRVREKPVFGEDYLNRRRYANDNFYDDIFGGDESPCRTPIKHERHPFSSTPGSRILSPVPPLPPAPDSISPSSLPSTLSLPAKLTKGTDLPTFGSPARSLRMSNKDAASNGLSSSDSPATHLSRFSSHTTRGMEESKNGSGTMRPSRSSQEISDLSISDKADKGGDSADYTEKTKMEKGIESKTPKSSAIRDISTTWKRQVEKTADLNGVEGSKATLQSMENVKVKGKVKEFVRIFSQEAVTKPRVGTKSSEYKLRSALRTTEEAEDNPQILKKVDSATEITNTSGDNLFRQDDISASGTTAKILDSTVAVEDGFFHGNFRVRELAQDDNEVFQTQNNQEIKVIDDKIRQWSNGKQGNIRSLLSTLQYVLWPDSGWKPLPLVDIIEGNAVKRAYQRALLCLHPDKLQQKGAASHQKYIAEKVFDILQEAWTHFNMLGAL
ncbi:J domain-containing protein required for chloroplast accumulation response 1 isoform X3 [Prosopis cineraria]|uniref:J domain-containing protein required for chloroplast accumulation response 1 isoform X3 n=1 Tax=Prosopis cineraria TaxID=364024 RepID=UPI00240FBEEA|nr:J domain-containing protein required for chloroplast accumulation response 1 isoform X3 [Prosopis cineraria]